MQFIRFRTFLTERIDNLFIDDIEKRKQYVDQIWSILQHSYAKIGGVKGSGFNDKEDMIDNLPLWKVFRRGDEVKAVIIYKDKQGRKSVSMGTDGSPEAKKMIQKMKSNEMSSKRSYGEVSDNALFFLIKTRKMDFLKDIIPAKEAIKRVKENGDEIEPLSLQNQRKFTDEIIEFFHGKDAHKLGMSEEDMRLMIHALSDAVYRRKIGSNYHNKVMVGNLNALPINKKE